MSNPQNAFFLFVNVHEVDEFHPLHCKWWEDKVTKLPEAPEAKSTIIRWNFLAPKQLFKAELLHAVFSNSIVLVFCKKSKSLWLHMI